MRREDISLDRIPYTEYLDSAKSYLYYAREHFLEGPYGEDGHTVVILFTKSLDDVCRCFCALNYWDNYNKRNIVQNRVFFDGKIEYVDFDRYLQGLVKHGVLEIPNEENSYSTAHFVDFIGAYASDRQQNWYSLVGSVHHTDGRHQKYILPFFNSELRSISTSLI